MPKWDYKTIGRYKRGINGGEEEQASQDMHQVMIKKSSTHSAPTHTRKAKREEQSGRNRVGSLHGANDNIRREGVPQGAYSYYRATGGEGMRHILKGGVEVLR